MNRLGFMVGLGILVISLTACGAIGPLDNVPPLFLRSEASKNASLVLVFNEPLSSGQVSGDFLQGPAKIQLIPYGLEVALPANLVPGREYRWNADVHDRSGNESSLSGRFYGPNGLAARLAFYEVRIAGSGNHSDALELLVVREGSLGGITIEYHASARKVFRKILPDVRVEKGNLVVVHYKPTGDGAEKDEVRDSSQSKGSDVFSTTWDYWQEHGKGLSSTEGLLELRESPDGRITEMLPWSVHGGDSSVFAESEKLKGLWNGSTLSPTGCSATRTWNRILPLHDNPTSARDWALSASGGSSIGLLSPIVKPSRESKTLLRKSRNPTSPPEVQGR